LPPNPAIDGVKLPSNADKRRSGTHAELLHEAERMERAVTKMVKAHRARDAVKEVPDDAVKVRARIERLQTEARRIREFLATHEERRSEKGAIRNSNVTDNDSAKMATSKGVIQGYAQRKSPWGHGGGGRGREGTDHRRCPDPSLEDIQYHLYVLEKVKRGLGRAATESAISHEDAKARLEKWLSV